MKYSKDTTPLDMPDGFKFGIELEAYNVRIKGPDGLYNGESAEYITEHNWHMATAAEESLVSEGGAELVSPILKDTPEDWQSITDMCEHMQRFPGNHGNKVVADDKCGLHVHFDAERFADNPDLMKNFLRLYAESEELLFKMCNPKGNPIRRNAINRNFKGIHAISSIWRKGMASPIGAKLLKQYNDGTLKVSYKKFGKLRRFLSRFKLDERRYAGLNLTNIGNPDKNTIEFRMANGSLNPEDIKQTVFLYASLLDTAINITEHPEEFSERLESFYQTDVTEQEKATRFLNLIMDSNEDRQIYMDRWESVKDTPVFADNHKKGFSQGRFKREQFKEITQRTPADRVKEAFAQIKQSLTRSLPTKEGEYSYDR